MLLTPIQSKILTSKISHFAPNCTNKYTEKKEGKKEKEKEKYTIIFTK